MRVFVRPCKSLSLPVPELVQQHLFLLQKQPPKTWVVPGAGSATSQGGCEVGFLLGCMGPWDPGTTRKHLTPTPRGGCTPSPSTTHWKLGPPLPAPPPAERGVRFILGESHPQSDFSRHQERSPFMSQITSSCHFQLLTPRSPQNHNQQ